MNVEGAEKVIVEDLLDSGVCAKVVGYYGMWDDVYKTNRGIYNDFINKLKENIIDNFTFNGRDFKIPLRMNIICSRSDLV
jgi:flavoprotein